MYNYLNMSYFINAVIIIIIISLSLFELNFCIGLTKL